MRFIGNNMTAADPKGLSRIELSLHSALLGVAATGLNRSLGYANRRCDLAILRTTADGRIPSERRPSLDAG